MRITPSRLNMARRCFTSANVMLIDDVGVVGNYMIPGDLFAQYCLRQVHKVHAMAVKHRAQERNKRK